MSEDRTPVWGREAFHCPSCGVYAAQHWAEVALYYHHSLPSTRVDGLSGATCASCDETSLWKRDQSIYPLPRVGVAPNEDMPDEVKAIYNEAREVAPISRKSAAGLLRLALQMLVDELVPGRQNIVTKIGKLVSQGLDPRVQRAMDTLRVVGNESVHPGQIDLDADADLTAALFGLLNIIVEQVITRPNHIDALYAKLPETKREAIERRDGPVASIEPPASAS